MVDMNPRDPYSGLKTAEKHMNQVHSHIGCIVTAQAQSLCIISIYNTNKYIVFDSHSRKHNGRTYGSCILFFECLIDLCEYIKYIFPRVEQPEMRYLSEMEQLQYAHLSVGQIDFFCLSTAYESSQPYKSEYMRAEQLTLASSLPLPSPSPQLPVYDRDFVASVQSLLDISTTQLKAAIDDKAKIQAKYDEAQHDMNEMHKEMRKLRDALDEEKRNHKKTSDNFKLLQMEIEKKKNNEDQDYQEVVKNLMEELENERLEHQRTKLNFQNFQQQQNHAEEEKLLNEQIRKFAEEEKLLNEQIQRIAEEEKNRLIQIEIDLQLAKELFFPCCICLDPEVSIEDKFDLEHDDHFVCRDCATSYIGTHLKDRRIPIKCPHPECTIHIYEAKCFEVLSIEHQNMYFDLSKCPHSDPAFRQCPKPNCPGYFLLDDNSNDCTCYLCNNHWCCQCQVDLDLSQHRGITCEKYQEWKRNNDSGDDAMEKFLRAGLSDMDGDDRMRRCPKCRAAYMKDKACSHVVCTGGCGVHFCFRCAEFHSDNAQGVYDHQSSCRGYQGNKGS